MTTRRDVIGHAGKIWALFEGSAPTELTSELETVGAKGVGFDDIRARFVIMANGLLNIPNLTAGCTCNYAPVSAACVPARVVERLVGE